MSSNNQDLAAAQRDADSRADMWCSVALVALAWAVAIFWVSGQS